MHFCIEMKELQKTYSDLVGQVQGIIDAQIHLHEQQPQHPPRTTSPSFFAIISKPTRTRLRSHTNPPGAQVNKRPLTSPSTDSIAPHLAYKQLASAFYTLFSKYRISWECAELLIELGGRGGDETAPSIPSTSVSAPVMSSAGAGLDLDMKKGGRERAITLAGDESKPPPILGGTFETAAAKGTGTPLTGQPPGPSWRASTGRNDLSQRQLVLLKEMLNSADSANALATANEEDEGSLSPTAVLNMNREWRWGDAMGSTVTLPSEDSSTGGGEFGKQKKKRGGGRLAGMMGLREMLRSLKRSHSENPGGTASLGLPVPPASSTSLSTMDNSSQDGHLYPHPHLPSALSPLGATTHGRRRAKTSVGPESVKMERPTSPYAPSSLPTKPSPRRPSLAAIFRIGQKNKDKANVTSDGPLDRRDDNFSRSDLSRPDSARSLSRNESASTGEEEEDWDQIDLVLDSLGNGSGTVRGKGATNGNSRGKSPYMQDLQPSLGRTLASKRSVSGSQSSLWGGKEEFPPPLPQQGLTRTMKLSNVEERVDDQKRSVPRPPSRASSRHGGKSGPSPSSSRPPSRDMRIIKTGSVRSMPPTPPVVSPLGRNPKLAMTPENIKPLLENAKVVLSRLNDCIAETEALIATHLPS